MARIRSIKPEFFTSLSIADLELAARLTFIGLWTHCDDEGRCVDDARLIKAALWPLDDRSSEDVEKDLCALSESSLIVRYEVSGRRYLAVRGWTEHQRVNRPTASKHPAPEKGIARPPTSANEDALEAHQDLTDDSVRAHGGKGKEQGTGNREVPPTAGADAPRHDHPPTEGEINKRAQALATAFHEQQPMSKFPAVLSIAKRAITSGRYDDQQIHDALLRLAGNGRAVTVDALRIELDGPPRDSRFAPNSGSRAKIPTSDEIANGQVIL